MIPFYLTLKNELTLFCFEKVSKTWHKCASCSVFLPSTDALADHMTKSHKCSKEVVSCHFCKHQCETEGSYYDHANQSHLINIMETWEFCDHCFCYFPNTLVLQVKSLIPLTFLQRLDTIFSM